MIFPATFDIIKNKRVILLNWGILISVLAFFISVGSYLNARKAFYSSIAPSLIFKTVSEDYDKGIITVGLKNVGKGVCVKTFAIIETTDDEAFLSRPMMDIGVYETKTSEISSSKLKVRLKRDIHLITQDPNGNFYVATMEKREDRQHLTSFDKRMQSASGWSCPARRRYKKMNVLMEKAVNQGNTYVESEAEETRRILEESSLQNINKHNWEERGLK